jgi:hypothetical protein
MILNNDINFVAFSLLWQDCRLDLRLCCGRTLWQTCFVFQANVGFTQCHKPSPKSQLLYAFITFIVGISPHFTPQMVRFWPEAERLNVVLDEEDAFLGGFSGCGSHFLDIDDGPRWSVHYGECIIVLGHIRHYVLWYSDYEIVIYHWYAIFEVCCSDHLAIHGTCGARSM